MPLDPHPRCVWRGRLQCGSASGHRGHRFRTHRRARHGRFTNILSDRHRNIGYRGALVGRRSRRRLRLRPFQVRTRSRRRAMPTRCPRRRRPSRLSSRKDISRVTMSALTTTRPAPAHAGDGVARSTRFETEVRPCWMSLPRRGSSAFVVAALTGPDYAGRRFGTLLAHSLPQNATKRHDCALLSHCVYTW
jgi:hypothetical protein